MQIQLFQHSIDDSIISIERDLRLMGFVQRFSVIHEHNLLPGVGAPGPRGEKGEPGSFLPTSGQQRKPLLSLKVAKRFCLRVTFDGVFPSVPQKPSLLDHQDLRGLQAHRVHLVSTVYKTSQQTSSVISHIDAFSGNVGAQGFQGQKMSKQFVSGCISQPVTKCVFISGEPGQPGLPGSPGEPGIGKWPNYKQLNLDWIFA